jgi:predicted DsbA family dithiol-disulfide isomerase
MTRVATDLVVYGDFNCPYSCLASSRADALVARGDARIEWRAVEHDPAIPSPSEPVEGELAAMLDREVGEIRGLLGDRERFPIVRPPVHPNSATATAAFAAAPPPQADELRRQLFTALWFDGRDIGVTDVVAELGGDATVAADAAGDAALRVVSWRAAWSALAPRVVPMLVFADGRVARGVEGLARLAELLR